MSAPLHTVLVRETFEISRALEFFSSEKELTAQLGFSKTDRPVALLKELLDNALDACESANIAPVITVELYDDALIVADNGPGLPLATLQKSLDYTLRYSDKLGYVSPSRGQQGNALKTLWAAPFVATGGGRIEVETATYRREVRITLDRKTVIFEEILANGFPVIVAKIDEKVVGFGYYNTFRYREAYKYTVEHSVYVAEEYQGKKIGYLLINELIALAKNRKIHTMIGVIDSSNQNSVDFS